MNKPILAIDFDDVVADFNQPFAAYHNKNYGSDITYDDINDFDLCTVYQIDRATFVERAKYFCHHHHDTIPLIAGASVALNTLHDSYELYIVTSRWGSLKEITDVWLENNLPGIFSEVHFVNQHTGDHQNERKSTLCHEIGAQLLIDDSLNHAKEAVENNLPVILIDCPWNQGCVPEDVTRVPNWSGANEWIFKNITQ